MAPAQNKKESHPLRPLPWVCTEGSTKRNTVDGFSTCFVFVFLAPAPVADARCRPSLWHVGGNGSCHRGPRGGVSSCGDRWLHGVTKTEEEWKVATAVIRLPNGCLDFQWPVLHVDGVGVTVGEHHGGR